jgi:site-specific DNA-methyltransferase (adenine-specific)
MIEVNKIYNEDNLITLSAINDNVIDVIYIDSPFSTGQVFKTKDGEIAYEDKYTLEQLINLLKPRLIEMRRVLKETGNIFIHGDYRFIPYLRIECDKIFGIENFRNEIIWWYRRFPAKQKNFQFHHDTILWYSKTNNYIYNELWTDKSEKSSKKGRRLVDTGNGTRTTIYIDEETKTRMGNVWEISLINSQAKERTGYPTQKPKELLERILKASLPKVGDRYEGLVADFFAGSGTTLEVAKELGVSYIGCDNSPIAIKYIEQRLNNTAS